MGLFGILMIVGLLIFILAQRKPIITMVGLSSVVLIWIGFVINFFSDLSPGDLDGVFLLVVIMIALVPVAIIGTVISGIWESVKMQRDLARQSGRDRDGEPVRKE